MSSIKTGLLAILLLCLSACDSESAPKKVTSDVQQVTPAVLQKDGYSNIANDKLAVLLKQKVLLIDIRREDEWRRTGIVKGSKTLTFFDARGNINPDFVPQLSKLATPEQTVMLICQTGGRTQAVSAALVKQLGYKSVMNVTDGIMGWIRDNRAVVRYTP